ncbi:MAG: hypothetical protein OEN50_07825 [Deltaproteobacteria bacterium]|nr:hypothetical protein [Deltaproteobacteria bacterium]
MKSPSPFFETGWQLKADRDLTRNAENLEPPTLGSLEAMSLLRALRQAKASRAVTPLRIS